jgi:hypothetical protein
MGGVVLEPFVVSFLATEGKSVTSKHFVVVMVVVVVVAAGNNVVFFKA